MMKLIAGLLFVGLNYYVYSYLATDEVVPERSEFANFSNEVGDWSCRGRMAGRWISLVRRRYRRLRLITAAQMP